MAELADFIKYLKNQNGKKNTPRSQSLWDESLPPQGQAFPVHHSTLGVITTAIQIQITIM